MSSKVGGGGGACDKTCIELNAEDRMKSGVRENMGGAARVEPYGGGTENEVGGA